MSCCWEDFDDKVVEYYGLVKSLGSLILGKWEDIVIYIVCKKKDKERGMGWNGMNLKVSEQQSCERGRGRTTRKISEKKNSEILNKDSDIMIWKGMDSISCL